MAIEIGERPAQLHGCWSQWSENDVPVVIATNMESGAVKTRRRFTGISRVVNASVTYPASLYTIFRQWWEVNQRQGAIATRIITPYQDEEVFQWSGPPKITWPDPQAFTVSVTMFQGSWF